MAAKRFEQIRSQLTGMLPSAEYDSKGFVLLSERKAVLLSKKYVSKLLIHKSNNDCSCSVKELVVSHGVFLPVGLKLKRRLSQQNFGVESTA